MSVPVSERSVSKLEFYSKMTKLTVDIIRFLAKEFGERVITNFILLL